MHTYIGVGDVKMCSDCGVDVRNITRHDKFHAQLDKLRTENLELSVKVEKLERERTAFHLVGV